MATRAEVIRSFSEHSLGAKMRRHFFSCLVACVLQAILGGAAASAMALQEDIYSMSLSELTELRMVPLATLAPVPQHLMPASVTRITREQIELSGARSLDELLEIYVPGLLVMSKPAGSGPQLGLRGILTDRNNKLVILVNDRVMNDRTLNGAITERHLSMLGDIAYIDVIRGPGSPVYGTGAIAGIISIRTFSYQDFEGLHVQLRQGFRERFTGLDLRHASRFSENSGLFLYYGIDYYQGSDQRFSPLIFSTAFDTPDSIHVEADEPVPFDIENDNEAYRGRPRHKLHVQYTDGGFDGWIRYSSGGRENIPRRSDFDRRAPPADLDSRDLGIGYQQLTLMTTLDQSVLDNLTIRYRLSADILDFENNRVPFFETYREEEFNARATLLWQPAQSHVLAVGTEFSHERFGRDGLGYPDQGTFVSPQLDDTPAWITNAFAVFGEYNLTYLEDWNLTLGVRADDHTYTDWTLSPRAAVVYSPNPTNSIKALFNRSNRRSDDSDLRAAFLKSGQTSGTIEDINVYELRYERLENERLHAGISIYYNNHNIVAWDPNVSDIRDVGRLQTYGIEADAGYDSDPYRVTFSHSFNKLIELDLSSDSTVVNNISTSPYGYGTDLINWSNHISKVSAGAVHSTWSALATLRYFWGFPGAEDLARYNKDVLGSLRRLPLTDGSTRAFEESVFLNFGFEFRPIPQGTVRLDAYNLLGWFDKDFNKRNNWLRGTKYRAEAEAFALSVRYEF